MSGLTKTNRPASRVVAKDGAVMGKRTRPDNLRPVWRYLCDGARPLASSMALLDPLKTSVWSFEPYKCPAAQPQSTAFKAEVSIMTGWAPLANPQLPGAPARPSIIRQVQHLLQAKPAQQGHPRSAETLCRACCYAPILAVRHGAATTSPWMERQATSFALCDKSSVGR